MIIKKENKITVPYIIVLFLIGIPLTSGTLQQYIVILAITVFLVIFNFSFHIVFRVQIDRFPLYFLVLWILGVMVGFLNGNSTSDIMQNYAGMAVYLLGIVLLNAKRINYELLFKVLYIASVIVSIEILVVYGFYIRKMIPPWPLSNIRYNDWTLTIYAGIGVAIFVLVAISLWNILHGNEKKQIIVNIFLFIISTLAIFSTMDSGGYFLGYAIITVVILVLSFSSRKMSKLYWVFTVLFFFTIIGIAIFYEWKTGAIRSIFSVGSAGNGKRFYQFRLVFDRFKILGNGLGSHLTYYYGRKRYDSYGLEVSYLNIIDKFGLVGFFIIGLYIYSFIKPIIMLRRKQGIEKYNVMALGLQGFLFVAMGNPVIYAPYNVVMHIFAILFISYNCRYIKDYGDK